jgi:DNA repair protein RadC
LAKVIYAVALKSGATQLALCHNHPSGNKQPSMADISLTKKLKAAGEYLDIAVIEHMILTSEGYYSFADEGML